MPRPLDHVHREIVRVADEMGVDPRSSDFTRKKFFSHGKSPNLAFEESDDGKLVLTTDINNIDRPTDVTKHDLETYGGFAKLKHDAAHVIGVPSTKDQPAARGVELRNRYVRKLERIVASRTYLNSKLESILEEVFSKNPVKLNKKRYSPKTTKTTKILNLLWSDLHFGVDVFDYEVYGNQYTWTVAARRMSKLCVEAVQWEPSLEDTEVRVFLNGDILQGVIHLDDANIRPLTEQIWGATAILTSAIDFLRQFFTKVTVVCLPGNHDRTTYKNSTRELSQRWDSHAHSLYLALKMAFRGTDVVFDIPTTGIALVDDLNDGYILASHGDTEPDPKNVSKKIDTDRMATNLLKLKELPAVDKNISVALFGHWHTPTIQMLPNGSFLVVNGCLIGTEPYGQNAIGVFGNQPAQVMFESRKGAPIARTSIVPVACADADDSLEDVIATPTLRNNGQLVI